MMQEKEIKRISKFLSFVLRHQPGTIGIQLDQNGWADVAELIQKSNEHGVKLDRQTLDYVVATNAKKRFAWNEAMDKIRASQGHSIEIELGYVPQQPPEILFHGTGEKSVQSILENGIEKRSRQHVHLSADFDTAIQVGRRHGKPHVFQVMAGKMHNENFPFFISDNGVWLTDFVPAEYLRL